MLSAGDVVVVFFSVVMSTMSLGQIAPELASFASGQGAAAKVFAVISRQPAIDSLSEDGLQPESVEGRIRFEDVHFTYPSRPEESILRGLDLDIKPKETVRPG